MKTELSFIFLLLIIFRCALAQFHIIGTQDVHSYNIIAEKKTFTLTECIVTCQDNDNCALSAFNDKDGQCFLLKDKVRNEQYSRKHSRNDMAVVKMVGKCFLIHLLFWCMYVVHKVASKLFFGQNRSSNYQFGQPINRRCLDPTVSLEFG